MKAVRFVQTGQPLEMQDVALELVRHRKLDLSGVITKIVPLEAGAINDALDSLERFDNEVRMVVIP